MKTILMILILGLAFLVFGTAGSQLKVKLGDKETSLEIKSVGIYYGNVISTAPDKPNIQTFNHSLYIANYKMDTTNAATMRTPLTSPEQMRILITLTGEDGTKTDSPFKIGTYLIKNDKINDVRAVSITTFVDSAEVETEFDTMSSMSQAEGEVRIISVTSDSVKVEVDLTEGDKSIKGAFTAKLPTAAKK